MNVFFLEFRDPLFSIIVFFSLIFIVTFFSYWWGRYKRKEDFRSLNKFLKQFEVLPSNEELQDMVLKDDLNQQSWMLLASSYFKSGNFDKSIEIYNQMLKAPECKNQQQILYLLGATYFKAGFLQRSRDVFLELLRKSPRTPQALEKLLLVYESMKDYKSALEVLEPLDELKQDISSTKSYLQILILLNDVEMSLEEKTAAIVSIYQQTHKLNYMVFEFLFRVDPQIAWENFDSSKSSGMVDLLWRVPYNQLNLEVIKQNSYLRDLYSARGDVDFSEASDIFEFDVLIKLKNRANATLSFEYICYNCKQLFPFAFHRCTNCQSVDTIGVELGLSKDFHRRLNEESNSFQ